MRKWMRIGFVTVLVIPFCLALSSLNSYITNPLGMSPGVSILLANGEDLQKEEPQKAVIEEKPEEVSKEPEIKKVEPTPIETKSEEKGEIKAVEEKPKLVEEKPKPIEETPQVVEEKPQAVEEKPKEVAKKNNFFLDLRSSGFFSDIDYRGIGIIVESKEGKILMGEGDIVYLTFTASESVSIGNKYTVFRASDLVDHPITGKKIGRRYNIIGNIQIIDRYGRFYVARVLEVFDSMSKGDFIRPYFKQIMEVEQGIK